MNDIRLAFRLCRRHALLSLAAIASLALGIGANTAIFTVLNAAVLRPLPFAEPDRFAGVALVLSLIAIAATAVPARRAMRIDPMTALREG